MPVTRRTFLQTAAAAGMATAFACGRTPRRPNVVFILTDDQRWDCLGVAGHPFLKTPNLDRIANEGVRFANAFATHSLCSPSRASFLSGLYSHQHGVQNNFTEFPAQVASYPKALQAAGYRTGYIGKWHMGEGNDEARPGFDYWASHKGQGQYNDTEFNVNGTRQVMKGYYAHTVTDLAKAFLKSNQRPFALVVGHKAPHGLWVPEPKYAHTYDNVAIAKPATATLGPGTPDWVTRRVKTWHGIDGPLYGAKDYDTFVRTYLETILSVDDSVGEITETLRAMGELDNTILVFAGDQGFLLGEHASIDKRTAWEESIRLPFLIRYPEVIKSPRVVPEMVLNMDLAPTVVDLCGVSGYPATPGRSLRPLMAGTTPAQPWRSSFLYEYNFESEFPYTPNVRAVRTDEWKYIHYPNGEGQPDTELAELYHLKADPHETTNLINDAASQPTLTSLKAELQKLLLETGAVPDRMPVSPQLRFELPNAAIR
jgi:arylsulfatase A-like enzyme